MSDVIEVKPISTDSAKEFTPRINSLEFRITGLVIETPGDLEECAAIISQLEGFKDALNEKRLSITRPIDAAKAAVMELFRPSVDKCAELSKIGRDKYKAFTDEQERLRKEHQAKLDEMARKQADKEKKALEDKAAKAAASGNTAKAEELKEKAAAVTAAPAIAAPRFQAPKGAAAVVNWKWRVTDINKIPREFMIPDEKTLNKLASAYKDTRKIEGIEIYAETSNSFKKAK